LTFTEFEKKEKRSGIVVHCTSGEHILYTGPRNKISVLLYPYVCYSQRDT